MKFKKQSISIDILEMDSIEKVENARRHGPLLPNTIRAIVCGPSNCGKTTALLSLLLSPNGLRFMNVYIFSKSLNQPKYQFLNNVLSDMKTVGYFPYSNNADIVHPQYAIPHSVFIFDDIACDKQDVVKEYFAMGRHNNIDMFYLCQSYAQIPKHLIRDNANFLLLFKQDGLNLKNIYNSHVNTDMSYDKFQAMCEKCWSDDNYGFLIIDKDSGIENGRYRKGFDTYITL